MQPASKAPVQAATIPEEETLDLSVWTPMGETDRAKVQTAYEDRVSLPFVSLKISQKQLWKRHMLSSHVGRLTSGCCIV